ncbi:hypothetical protein M758_6G071500 [Ceratodon purpureus]|nr:hypothetical protein M758_6G071500 [Ceratodon purpureus]
MKPRARTVVVVALVVTLFALPYLFLFRPSAEQFLCAISARSIMGGNSDVSSVALIPEQGTAESEDDGTDGSAEMAALEAMLASAATPDKTVIITTLNQAWATKGTMIDVFLESFHKGEGTQFLLNHLVIVVLDQRSHERCREVHGHCLMLKTAGVDFSGSKGFMSKDFLKMMWRRMSLLRSILELGYNFVFTDADILWFRNPFEHFANNTDFQISCDKNRGNAWSLQNKPNCGYQYARSNERTIAMYRHWCRGGDANPDIDEQSLLNRMLKSKEFTTYKVEIRFLPTERFSGFCQKSKNMSRVVTMHANCCTGLDNKVHDLRSALSDWEARKSLPPGVNTSEIELWHVPSACRHSLWPSPPPPVPELDPEFIVENRK